MENVSFVDDNYMNEYELICLEQILKKFTLKSLSIRFNKNHITIELLSKMFNIMNDFTKYNVQFHFYKYGGVCSMSMEVLQYFIENVIFLCENMGISNLELHFYDVTINNTTYKDYVIYICNEIFDKLNNKLEYLLVQINNREQQYLDFYDSEFIELKNKINEKLNSILGISLIISSISFHDRYIYRDPQISKMYKIFRKEKNKYHQFKKILYIANEKRKNKIGTLWNGYYGGGESSLFYKNTVRLNTIEKILNYI